MAIPRARRFTKETRGHGSVLCPRATGAHGRTPRDALEGKGPQKRFQKRLDGRLEGVAEAVGGGYCRLQMPLKLDTCRQGDSGWA